MHNYFSNTWRTSSVPRIEYVNGKEHDDVCLLTLPSKCLGFEEKMNYFSLKMHQIYDNFNKKIYFLKLSHKNSCQIWCIFNGKWSIFSLKTMRWEAKVLISTLYIKWLLKHYKKRELIFWYCQSNLVLYIILYRVSRKKQILIFNNFLDF